MEHQEETDERHDSGEAHEHDARRNHHLRMLCRQRGGAQLELEVEAAFDLFHRENREQRLCDAAVHKVGAEDKRSADRKHDKVTMHGALDCEKV